jgi:uncharacterized protein YjbI with pentapeptide repeats
MTRDETVALWQQCASARDAALAEGKSPKEAHEAAKWIWNAWARPMLEARHALEASGRFIAKKDEKYDDFVASETMSSDPATQGWMQAAMVNFSGFMFEERADFGGFIFPGQALFGDSARYTRTTAIRNPTTFAAGARFSEAVFHMDTVFDWSEFNQAAGFRDAEFRGIARFDECKFKSTAWFFGARFFDDVWFGQCKFGGFTNFSRARFGSVSSFSAARSDGAFTLGEAVFAKLPDLVQTSFRETPRLDNVSLPAPAFFPGLKPKAALEEQAKFRAIRRLAIAGQDHDNESMAFKGEVRSRRGTLDKPWHSAFWFGALYDVLSDFGRSMMRPFYFWLISIAGFTAAYLADAGKLADYAARCAKPNADAAPQWLNALAVAAKNALVFAGSDRRMEPQYACLYGDAVPVTGTFIQMGQTVWSAILLAVRNRFKLK